MSQQASLSNPAFATDNAGLSFPQPSLRAICAGVRALTYMGAHSLVMVPLEQNARSMSSRTFGLSARYDSHSGRSLSHVTDTKVC